MNQGQLTLRSEPLRDHPDAIRVVLDGSVDPKTVNKFRDDLLAISSRGVKRFLVDCAKLTYVNSSGLAFLLNLAGGVKPKGGAVVLAALDPKILVIFKMMGIVELFQFQPTYAAALRELDEKLAAELRDVGPALQLEEAPKPPPPTPRPTARPVTRVESTRRMRTTSVSAPSTNPIVAFFRALFGLDDVRPAIFSKLSRKRR
jgi:anti-sigma B factor antagonist